MTRKSSAKAVDVSERSEIAARLANGDRPFVHWAAPNLGRVSLKFGILTLDAPIRFYELNHVAPMTELRTMPAKRYIFRDTGDFVGVVSSDLILDDNGKLVNIDEVEESMRFQISNSLSAPNYEDRHNLDELLMSGVGNPSLKSVPDGGIDEAG
jgi:hypothetical protein